MNELLLLSMITAVSLHLFPRYDGVVVELVGQQVLNPAVQASGSTVRIDFGEQVNLVETTLLPIWIDRLTADSSGFTVEFDLLIASADWALSGDSLSMIVFARAEEEILLPPVAWQSPPAPPDTTLWSDSLVYAALERGDGSPWLVDFDCIVIDPGHGGRDPGAVGASGSQEKDRTLEISLMVRDLLRIRMPELRVVLTRTVDEYVSLGTRTLMANRNRADLFVSIHCNAAENRSAHGFETYFLSRARTDDARAVEMLENNVLELDEVSAVPDDPLSFLLADMAQSIFQNQSSHLAGAIQSRFGHAFPVRRDRGVKRAGFYVLRGAYMPAVLVEVGFISNPEEEQGLLSLDFRFRAAQAIVESIIEYAERES
ncbi:MAG: N-acetylmuramoyl-L-alanine amidase [Candidatus Sabulitectum sp.]|nr:N-acetylmuramoyl-L-alanine amidase [Candidatus Sabulitectum sp.]